MEPSAETFYPLPEIFHGPLLEDGSIHSSSGEDFVHTEHELVTIPAERAGMVDILRDAHFEYALSSNKPKTIARFIGATATEAVKIVPSPIREKVGGLSSVVWAKQTLAGGAKAFRAVGQDWKEKETKLDRNMMRVSVVGVVVVQAAGFTKAPSALPVSMAFGKLQEIGGVAGATTGTVVAAALYGGWNLFVAHTMNNAIDRLPNACATANDNIPSPDKIAHTMLPGLEPAEKYSLGTRVRRGLATVAPGTSAYLMTAAIEDQSHEARKKLCNNIGIDTAIFMGGIAAAASGTILAIQQKDPVLAEKMMTQAGDNGNLFKAAIAVNVLALLSTGVKSKLKSKSKRELQASED